MKQKYQILLDVEIEYLDQADPITEEQAKDAVSQMGIDGGVYVELNKISFVEGQPVRFPTVNWER